MVITHQPTGEKRRGSTGAKEVSRIQFHQRAKIEAAYRPQGHRRRLLGEIASLAEIAIFGTLSETYRTCGQAGCHCQGDGPKHGPHLNVSYRGEEGQDHWLLQVTGSSQWLDRCREPAPDSPAALVVGSTEFDPVRAGPLTSLVLVSAWTAGNIGPPGQENGIRRLPVKSGGSKPHRATLLQEILNATDRI